MKGEQIPQAARANLARLKFVKAHPELRKAFASSSQRGVRGDARLSIHVAGFDGDAPGQLIRHSINHLICVKTDSRLDQTGTLLTKHHERILCKRSILAVWTVTP